MACRVKGVTGDGLWCEYICMPGCREDGIIVLLLRKHVEVCV